MVDTAVGDVVGSPVAEENPVASLGKMPGQGVDLRKQGVAGELGQQGLELVAVLP